MIPQINKILQGNCKDVLKTLPDNSVDCCITSPPYFGLRDYGMGEQIGLEETPEQFVAALVEVFTEVKRVLKPEGTCWVNLGDSYAGSGKGGQSESKRSENWQPEYANKGFKYGLKPKDLIGIPWMVAFALRSSGWYLRQDIIWNKPNPMPESVTDRCTKSHEYIFLLSKSAKYYYDAESIKTELKDDSIKRMGRGVSSTHKNINGAPGQTPHSMNQTRENIKAYKHRGEGDKGLTVHSGNYDVNGVLIGGGLANKKSVWTVNTMPYKESHFATFPQKLIVDMIKAGCPENGIVLDPFMGAGTTVVVAKKLNRNYIGIELNPEYIAIAEKRIYKEIGLFN